MIPVDCYIMLRFVHMKNNLVKVYVVNGKRVLPRKYVVFEVTRQMQEWVFY